MKPKTGIHRDIEMSIYGTWDAANYSVLKHFARSPAHAREALVRPHEQTPAMLLGQATHHAVLEPALFAANYAVAPQLDRRFKADKLIWEEFLMANKGKEILKPDEHESCVAMARSAHANPVVAQLVESPGYTELSFAWEDIDTDVLCKGRCDRFGRLFGNSVIADLKTTENASPEAWKREVVKYQYNTQAAYYLDGMQTIAVAEGRRFVWIAVEKSPPYAVAVYEPDVLTIEKGRSLYRRYLRAYAAAQKSGSWPGYSSEVQSLQLPEWALRYEENDGA